MHPKCAALRFQAGLWLAGSVRRSPLHFSRTPPMSQSAVSIHPYFKVRPGQLDAAKALLPAFVAKTETEPACLYYEFTINDDTVFCREAYVDAEGTLAHLANVGDELAAMLKLSELSRLELHGPAEELDKLRGPLADLKPAWFVSDCGVTK